MLLCDQVRERLALGAANDAVVVEHVAECQTCAAYERRNTVLDGVLRHELLFDVPAALTAQLLALAALPLGALPLPRPPRWYVRLVAVLTLAAVVISALLIAQGLAYLAAQAGLPGVPALLWHQISAWLGQFGDVDRAVTLAQNLAMWVLASALLWMIFDRVRGRVTA